MNETQQVAYWRGKAIDQLTIEELKEALNWLAMENFQLRSEIQAVRGHIDWPSYLSSK